MPPDRNAALLPAQARKVIAAAGSICERCRNRYPLPRLSSYVFDSKSGGADDIIILCSDCLYAAIKLPIPLPELRIMIARRPEHVTAEINTILQRRGRALTFSSDYDPAEVFADLEWYMQNGG